MNRRDMLKATGVGIVSGVTLDSIAKEPEKEFWHQEPFDITRDFHPHRAQGIMQDIESHVLNWLKDDKADSVLQLYFTNFIGQSIVFPTALFSRAEIYIKSAANCWEVWRIATCSCYPKMISYKVKSIGMNQFIDDTFKLPNEVRCQSYSEFTEPEGVVWNKFGDTGGK